MSRCINHGARDASSWRPPGAQDQSAPLAASAFRSAHRGHSPGRRPPGRKPYFVSNLLCRQSKICGCNGKPCILCPVLSSGPRRVAGQQPRARPSAYLDQILSIYSRRRVLHVNLNRIRRLSLVLSKTTIPACPRLPSCRLPDRLVVFT